MGEGKEMVNHPDHYNRMDVEVLEMMRRIWGEEEVAVFLKLSAFKYRMRMGYKDDPERELKKALNCEDLYFKYHNYEAE